MKDELKVYRMDDFSWVAAESEEKAIEWYHNETGTEIEEVDKVCDIDKEGMWWVVEAPEGMEYGDEPFIDGVQYGWWEGEPCKYISFREAHKLYNEKMPYIIAQTDC